MNVFGGRCDGGYQAEILCCVTSKRDRGGMAEHLDTPAVKGVGHVLRSFLFFLLSCFFALVGMYGICCLGVEFHFVMRA